MLSVSPPDNEEMIVQSTSTTNALKAINRLCTQTKQPRLIAMPRGVPVKVGGCDVALGLKHALGGSTVVVTHGEIGLVGGEAARHFEAAFKIKPHAVRDDTYYFASPTALDNYVRQQDAHSMARSEARRAHPAASSWRNHWRAQ